MRKLLILSLLVLISSGVVNAQKKDKKNKKSTETIALTNKQDTISYILGADIGKNLKGSHIDITIEPFVDGLKDAMKDTNKFPQQKIDSIMNIFQKEMMAKQEAEMSVKSKVNKEKGIAFLAENKKKEGVVELPSGLQYKIITPGLGENPKPSDEVTVHYTGTLLDGTIFDSSIKTGKPVTFPLSGVITGWTEGLQQIKPGGKIMLFIKSDLAYGDREVGPIPAGSLLTFEVELLSINPPSETK